MATRIKPFAKPLSIRLLRKGCANRPFYHIIAVPTDDRCISEGIEQLGVFDPMPNEFNERLLALNVERFKHYVSEGAWIRSSTAMLLGELQEFYLFILIH
ncbi:unnamed protein product [Larinioides sclopetarius]|uniref:Small ribosomal subunit protein bS16m n=1 Tax=Larinioides sclopetarius TaxID=280406 RepID=A0AAV2A4Z7_9ARAC